MPERFDDERTRERTPELEDSGVVGQTGLTGAEAPDEDPAAIRSEIQETRDRLGDTLEQIGERLNPQNIKEQVKENVRDATIGKVENMARSAADRVSETRYTIMDSIRENPIPATMVGIGLGWLFMNRRRGGSEEGRHRGMRYGVVEPSDTGDRYAIGEGTGAMGHSREGTSGIGHDVKETAGSLAHGAQNVAGAIADRTQDAAATVARQTRHQARRLEDRFYESPLAVGAATLAAGLAVGLALPATDEEVELMGGARDRMVDRARDVASETTEKVRHVAERVLDETTETAPGSARVERSTPA